MQNEKNKLLNFRVSDDLAKRLQDTARLVDRPASQIVREAIVDKLDAIARERAKVPATSTVA